MLARWKTWASRLKIEVYALYLAYRDPRTPWYAKAVAACVAGYAFSPIDLIPDPVPILGYLDDLLLIPLGVKLALSLIPPQVMADCRAQAQSRSEQGKPVNWVAAAAIIAIWVAVLALAGYWLWRWWRP